MRCNYLKIDSLRVVIVEILNEVRNDTTLELLKVMNPDAGKLISRETLEAYAKKMLDVAKLLVSKLSQMPDKIL